jgi:hypothetical protein
MGHKTSIGSDAAKMGFERNVEGGIGLEDVWIIGEPFFRDVQVAFNVSPNPEIPPKKN